MTPGAPGRKLDQRCAQMLKSIQGGGMYVPQGRSMTLEAPGEYGGGNWSGGSLDPSTNSFVVNTNNLFSIGLLQFDPKNPAEPYRRTSPWGAHAFLWDNQQVPCQAPPWGVLSSVDLNSGNISWQVPLGNLGAPGEATTGAPNIGGSIVTAGGLVFIGAATDDRFRAFDSATGKELWSAGLPAAAHATPATYWGKSKRKQYVVVAAGGGGIFSGRVSDAVIAFALPD